MKEIEGNFRNILSLFAHVVPNLYTDICMSNTEKGELLKIPYSSKKKKKHHKQSIFTIFQECGALCDEQIKVKLKFFSVHRRKKLYRFETTSRSVTHDRIIIFAFSEMKNNCIKAR